MTEIVYRIFNKVTGHSVGEWDKYGRDYNYDFGCKIDAQTVAEDNYGPNYLDFVTIEKWRITEEKVDN